MLPATVLPPPPPPPKFPWRDLRLPRVRLPEIRLPQVRWPHLSQVARHLERLPRLSRVARNLRLSVIDRRVRRVGGVAIGLVALVIVGALALARGGHPHTPAASTVATSARGVAAPAPTKVSDSGLLTAVTPAPVAEPLATPPTAAVVVPGSPASIEAGPAEIPAPAKRRIGEARAHRRPEPSRARAPVEADGITDL